VQAPFSRIYPSLVSSQELSLPLIFLGSWEAHATATFFASSAFKGGLSREKVYFLV